MDYSKYSNTHYPRAQPQQQYPQYPPGYPDPYSQQQQHQPPQHQSHLSHQQQQHYQPTLQSQQLTPHTHSRNPFAPPPPPTRDLYAGQNAAFDPEHEAQVAQWQAAYASHDTTATSTRGAKGDRGEHGGGDGGSGSNSNLAGPHLHASGHDHASAATAATDQSATSSSIDKKKTVVRKGGGQTWEDSTLLEWDPTQFRIMVGNLAGEVTDDSLAKAFAAYGVSKARVVRDKRTTKSRGYGFVAFTDGEMGFRAAREMVGKYIGSHPVTIQRSKTDIRPVVHKDRSGKGKSGNRGNGRDDRKGNVAKQNDPLRAHTGAHIERKPVRNVNGMKMLG